MPRRRILTPLGMPRNPRCSARPDGPEDGGFPMLLEDDPGIAQEVRDTVAMMLATVEAERRVNRDPVTALAGRERVLFDAGVEAGRLATVWTLRRRGWLRGRRRQ